MEDVYGLWDSKAHCWVTDGRSIIWGPNPVIQAQLRRLPPAKKEYVWIRRFNEFGQPADEDDQ